MSLAVFIWDRNLGLVASEGRATRWPGGEVAREDCWKHTALSPDAILAVTGSGEEGERVEALDVLNTPPGLARYPLSNDDPAFSQNNNGTWKVVGGALVSQ